MSPLKSDTATVTANIKQTTSTKKQTSLTLLDEVITKNDINIKSSSSTNLTSLPNGMPTPPLIKINRKYSRLSSNSSYESLPGSRSCSSHSSTSSRSRSVSADSNISTHSRESSTAESVRDRQILSSLSNSSNLKLKSDTSTSKKSSKKHHHHSHKHSKTKKKSKMNKSLDKSFDLESGDNEDENEERNQDQKEENETENDLEEMSIKELEKLTKHELILDDDEYDHIKQMFVNLSWNNQYKLALNTNSNSLMLTEKDQIGFWLAKTSTNHHNLSNKDNSNNGVKHHHHHHHHSHHYYSHTKSHMNSHNNIASNTFKNFNDWRSHLMYYKQVKGYSHSLPSYLKASNLTEKRATNNLPIIEKYSNNDHTKLLTNNDNARISYTNMTNFSSSYLISQSGYFPSNSTSNFNPNSLTAQKMSSQSTTTLASIIHNNINNNNTNNNNNNTNSTTAQKLDTSLTDNSSPQASTSSISNAAKRIKNIDFKIDSSMRRILEANQPILSQKLLPSTRVNKSIAGSLRLLPKPENTSKTPQQSQSQSQFQIPSHLINKIISSTNTNSTSQSTNLDSSNTNTNFVLNMTSLDEKFVKEFNNKNSSANQNGITSIGNTIVQSNPISEPGKRVIAFYHRVNENDYSVRMQDYTVNTKGNINNQDNVSTVSGIHNHDLVRWSKLTRPTLPSNLASILNNAKSPTSNQSSVNAHISSSLVHKKFNNLSNIQNRLQAQHQQLILHQQLNNGELANSRNESHDGSVKTDSTNPTNVNNSTIPAGSTNITTTNANSNSNAANSSSNDVIITTNTSNGNTTTRFANFLNQPVKFQIAN